MNQDTIGGQSKFRAFLQRSSFLACAGLAVLASLAATVGLTRTASAADDRQKTAKTAWLALTAQSGGDVATTVAQGYRIVDIKTDDRYGAKFSVTYVANQGAYGEAWWYLIGVDAASLSNFMTSNNARPTKIVAFDDGSGGTRFAAVMTPNTGANQKAWWWYYGTSHQALLNAAGSNNARVVSSHEYLLGAAGTPYVVGVMISNTGADQLAWWMYWGQSFAAIGTYLGQNQARPYALQQAANGTFHCIMVRDGIGPWWWWVGNSGQGLVELGQQWGARIFDVQNVNGSCNALFLENSNAVERRVANLMGSKTDGAYGFHLKRVGGAVLAELQANRVFEPASTIKTLAHYHAVRQSSSIFGVPLSGLLTVYTGTSGSCPQTTGPVSETLEVALRKMMENSDNNRTMAVVDRFTPATINATGVSLGMTGTSINHRLGCGGPIPNRMTLSDLGRLHESVATGALGSLRDKFRELMLEFPDHYAGGELDTVIAQEAAAVGLSSAQLAAFRSYVRQVFKGGSYTFLGPTREYRSWGSWIALPAYAASGIELREYVTGTFVDAGSDGNNATAAFNSGAAEVLREEIRSAMVTWKAHVPGSFVRYGHGCLTSAGYVPNHFGAALNASVEPLVGEWMYWGLELARANRICALYMGASRTRFGAYSLPLALDFLGMPGCTLDTSVDASFGGWTTASGQCSIQFTIPLNASLIGQHTYTQWAITDPAANNLGVVHSNALDTVPGGQR